jgi:hypothetical protein
MIGRQLREKFAQDLLASGTMHSWQRGRSNSSSLSCSAMYTGTLCQSSAVDSNMCNIFSINIRQWFVQVYTSYHVLCTKEVGMRGVTALYCLQLHRVAPTCMQLAPRIRSHCLRTSQLIIHAAGTLLLVLTVIADCPKGNTYV